MKKSKLMVSLLATTLAFGMSGCKDPLEDEDQQIVAVYKAYQANAEAKGEEALSYEDWLKTVKGEKGDPGTPGKDGKDGTSPTVTIGANGNWFINGVDTGTKAQGDKGEQGNPGNPGADGVTPVITIGDNGNWFINGVDTNKKAQGEKGADAVAPVISISLDNTWEIDGVDTGVVAKGADGKDAIAPVITINNEGYWCVNGVSMGVKAQGEKGDQGDPGDKGETGKSAFETYLEYYPHYAGSEFDWITDVAEGNLKGVPAGHGKNFANVTIEETEDEVLMKGDCAVCSHNAVINRLPKVTSATFHYDTEARSAGNKWAYDEETGLYSSTNTGQNSSTCYLDIVIDTAGYLEFEYTSSGEKGYDYLYFGPDTSEGHAFVKCNGQIETTGVYSGEFAAGDRIVFIFKKDNSGNAGADMATVKFLNGAVTYNVLTLNTKGGNAEAPMFLKNGRVVGDVPTPTYEGKYFEGWFVDEGLTTPFDPITAFNGNQTIYAKWSDGQFVTFYENGGTTVPQVMFRAGTTPEMPANPTRQGYVFLGWYTNEDLAAEHKYVPGNANAGFNLYAKWMDENDVYPLHGSYGGFKQSTSASVSDSYAEMTIDVEGNYSVRDNYSSYLTGTLGAYSASIPAVTTSNHGAMIYDAARGIIVFSKDATLSTSSTIFVLKKDAPTSKMDATVKLFKNGTTSNALRLISFKDGSETINMVVDLVDKVIDYDVDFVGLDGNDLAITSFGTNSSAVLSFKVMKNGSMANEYFYNGGAYVTTSDGAAGIYNNDAKGNLILSGAGKAYWEGMASGSWEYEKMAGENQYYLYYGSIYRYVVTLYDNGNYNYVERKVTITYDKNYEGAPAAETKQVLYNYWFDLDGTEPTRSGYVFDGWYNQANGGNKVERVSVTSDTTYYAHWLKRINVYFFDADGEPYEETEGCPESISAVEGSAIGTLPVPTKAGKIFMGWFTDNVNYTTEVTAATVATAIDMQLYAKWADPVTLFVDAGNALLDFMVEVKPGTVPVFDTPYREGHAVAGYYTDDSFSTQYDITQPINADTTIYVKWISGAPAYGTYKGFNLYNTGTESKTFSNFSYDLSVAADGAVTGRHTLTLGSGVNANIGDEDRYMYFSQELGILWTGYNANATGVGTDTNIFFDMNRNIAKVDFFKLGSVDGSYTFVGLITYVDGSTRLFAGHNNVIYADVTIEGKTFAELTGTSVTGYIVKDSAGNVIFSK